MSGLINCQRSFLRKIIPVLNQRLVSTSKKNNETVTIETCGTREKSNIEKNWITYGFDYSSKEADRSAMHSSMFASITLVFIGGAFYFIYVPGYDLFDWAQREAFLEIRRKEQKGLPLIDPNFIDPAKIVLPSDEELGDTEIII